MKFVVVNGRTPNRQSCCTMCSDPMGESYLRDLATGLAYCDHDCYLDNTKIVFPALQYHPRASCHR
jgi:hypothetical protein